MKTVLFAVFFVVGCAAPTLQQRQETWSRYRDSVRATCTVGKIDPAMPTDIKAWCAEVVAP